MIRFTKYILVITLMHTMTACSIVSQPDSSVVISTQTPLRDPKEVEIAITSPIEKQIRRIPGLREMRSFSMEAHSEVWAMFEEAAAVDCSKASRAVSEALGGLATSAATPSIRINKERCILPQRTEEQLYGALRQLNKEIRDMIGDGACSADSECRTIAYGHAGCGGPSVYLAYSIDKTDSSLLASKVARATEFAKEAIGRMSGVAFSCIYVTEPLAKCWKGRCSNVRPGPGGKIDPATMQPENPMPRP